MERIPQVVKPWDPTSVQNTIVMEEAMHMAHLLMDIPRLTVMGTVKTPTTDIR